MNEPTPQAGSHQQECPACGAEVGESCRPLCLGEAAHQDALGQPAASAGPWEGAEVIHAYSRAQALADGALVAVPSAESAEAGFRLPVALTAAAWADCVAWSESVEAAKPSSTGQSERGRLWDVLWMARDAVLRAGDSDRASFVVLRVPAAGRALAPRRAHLVVHIGPGDDPAPVMTIMQPGED